jgi:hypothetical protein
MAQSSTLDVDLDVQTDSLAVAYGAKDHEPRSAPLGRSGHATPTVLTSPVSSQHRPHASSWSLKPVLVAPGVSALCAQKGTPVGWWPPPSCPNSLGIGATPTAARRGQWPG